MIKQFAIGFLCAAIVSSTPVRFTAAQGFQDVKESFDLLKPNPGKSQKPRACRLQIDGSDIPCDAAAFILFKDGTHLVQFNKPSGHATVISFYGRALNDDIISIDRVGIGSPVDEHSAIGQCALGTMAAGCQARASDGRLFVGNIFPSRR